MTPTGGSHGKPHRTTKILSHAARGRGSHVAARGAGAGFTQETAAHVETAAKALGITIVGADSRHRTAVHAAVKPGSANCRIGVGEAAPHCLRISRERRGWWPDQLRRRFALVLLP